MLHDDLGRSFPCKEYWPLTALSAEPDSDSEISTIRTEVTHECKYMDYMSLWAKMKVVVGPLPSLSNRFEILLHSRLKAATSVCAASL
jgi:hypothetical protein